MTKEEYDKRMREAAIEYEEKKKNTAVEFALSNNPYKVGDILNDGAKIIRVDKIRVSRFLGNYPYCIYDGVLLTKKLVPYKNGGVDCILQNNVIEKLN